MVACAKTNVESEENVGESVLSIGVLGTGAFTYWAILLTPYPIF